MEKIKYIEEHVCTLWVMKKYNFINIVEQYTLSCSQIDTILDRCFPSEQNDEIFEEEIVWSSYFIKLFNKITTNQKINEKQSQMISNRLDLICELFENWLKR